MRIADVNANPSLLGFEVAPHELGITASQMWMSALRPLLELLEKEGDSAWEEIAARFDQYSTREFLEANHWSVGMIEMFRICKRITPQIHFLRFA